MAEEETAAQQIMRARSEAGVQIIGGKKMIFLEELIGDIDQFIQAYDEAKWKAFTDHMVNESDAVAKCTGIKFYKRAHHNKVVAMLAVIGTYQCRLCHCKGHTPSYCPVNAQMARQAQSNPDDHTAW